MIRFRVIVLAAVFALLLAGTAAFAQQATGNIVGTVTDPQGAVIVGARITVTNVDTGVKHQTTSDKSGYYQVLNLPIGSYQVEAEQAGFARLVTNHQKLEINQNLRVDLGMRVGSNSETVSVEAQTSGVETVSATLGASITSRPIVNMPLNGRNVLQLALLQPGVSETNTAINGTSNSQAGTFSVAGGKSDSVTFLLDGGNNNNLLSNGVVYNPNPDAVAEFRILQSNYSAEYGRNAGGIVSVVTKSGTNVLHGSVYEFLRNEDLNANSFFNKRNGLRRDILKRNQFGGTLGGPIVLPHVNGRDRMFWFVSYQGQRLVQQQSATSSTFTPSELAGDFSKSVKGGADPGVVKFLQANPYFQSNAALAAKGIIDPSRIDAVAQAYIKNNMIPTSSSGTLNSQGGGTDNRNELTMKFELLPTANDRISVTLGGLKNPTLVPFSGGANVPGYGINGRSDRYFANISYTKTITPTLLNEVRFTAQRQHQDQAFPQQKLPTAQQLGIGITPDDPTGPPRLGFDSGLSIGFSPQGPTTLIDDTFSYADTVTWVKGKHTWKFGGYFSPYDNNTVYDFYVNGEFFFGNGSNSIATGNSYADFLVGAPNEFLQFGRAPSNIREKSTYAFAQDEWHVRRDLVLTLGLRYEYDTPKLDTQGRSFSLKLGAQSQRFTKAPLGVLFPGDPGAPTGANFPDKNNWAPRFGFAYSPGASGKTAIRGGFGVFYDILKGEDNLQFNGQAPFFGYADIFPDNLANGTSAPPKYFGQPFASTGSVNTFPSKPPAANIDFDANGFLPFGGGGVYFVDPHLRTPYIYQYNLDVQQELISKLTADIAYVGSSTHKETALLDTNPFVLGTKTRMYNAQPNTLSYAYSYLDTFGNVAQANYSGLQTSLTKQMGTSTEGLASWFSSSYFTLGYTWQKSIDTASGFRNGSSRVPYYNHNLFRAVSDYDLTNRLTFSGAWELPFAKMFSNGPSRLTKGWTVYPITTWRTGFPIDLRGFLSRSRTRPGPSGAGDSNLVEPNLVGSSVATFDPHTVQTITNPLSGSSHTGSFWFSPANFQVATLSSLNSSGAAATNAALRTYGTLPRNFIRGPGRTNLDLALAKNTAITERLNAEFRAEFFNAFNHAEFNQPTTSFTSGTFGQITGTGDPRIIQFALRLTF